MSRRVVLPGYRWWAVLRGFKLREWGAKRKLKWHWLQYVIMMNGIQRDPDKPPVAQPLAGQPYSFEPGFFTLPVGQYMDLFT